MPKTWVGLTRDEELEVLREGEGQLGAYVIAGYAQVVRAEVPAELWSSVFFSWLSLKGHLQALHGWDRTQCFASRVGETVHAMFAVVFDRPEEFQVWVESGYTIDEMLRMLNVPDEAVEVSLLRDFS
jgi:hypothetical protein